MKKWRFAFLVAVTVAIANSSMAGVIPPSAVYYFTSNSVSTGELNSCATVVLSDWDGQFRRTGAGGQFLVGLLTYQNLTCTGSPSTLSGSFTSNLYFQAPVFEEIKDSILCAPFLTCVREVRRELVGQVVSDSIPFTLSLTANTGDPDGDRDGLFFPTANKSLFVREGETQSFFLTASYQSPISILNIIPLTSDGWVVSGTDPFGERIFASNLDREILSLAGVEIEVPEPSTASLIGIGFLIGLIRRTNMANNRKRV